MTAARELLFREIEDRLQAISLDPAVERMATGDPERFPALNIVDPGQSLSEEETGVTRYELALVIEGYVEGESGADAHGRLNELHAATIKALRAEPLLGDRAEEVREGELRVDVAELASARRLAFAQDFRVIFTTRAGDPSSS